MKIEVLYGSRDEIVFRNEMFFQKWCLSEENTQR